MADTILSTDFTVYYTGETAGTGEYQIKWTGTTGTYTVLEFYDALQHLFDNSTQMDNGSPMRLITPTSFTFGQIETNDPYAWFIDPDALEHLTGGAIQTTGWTKSPLVGDGTGNTGIIKVGCSSTGFNWTSADVGYLATSATSNTGMILYVDTANFEVWIRPTDNTANHDFQEGSGSITSARTGSPTVTANAAAVTGERLWANVYTIGSIVSGTQIYMYQEQTLIPEWWGTGHMDALILVNDGFDAGLIDDGLLTLYARDDFSLFDHFVVDASGGGRNAVPLAASADVNNASPGQTTDPGTTVISFGNGTSSRLVDVDADTTNEEYSIEIAVGGATVLETYEYLKHLTGVDETATLNGLAGEQFTGITARLDYSALSGLSVGDRIHGSTSGATGYIACIESAGASTNYVTVHNTQGTFQAESVTQIPAGGTMTISAVTEFTPNKQNPFGSFAGGRFFAAPGVVITGEADGNNYEVIDNQGNLKSEPLTIAITITVTNAAGTAISGAQVGVFRQSNGAAVTGFPTTTNGSGVATASIPNETTFSVWIRVRDVGGGTNYIPVSASGTVAEDTGGGGGLSVGITMTEDGANP